MYEGPFRMKKFLVTLTVVLSCLGSVSHAQLPPAMEADRQMLAAKAAMDASDWTRAVTALDAVEATGVKRLPESFNYHYARALNGAGLHDRAMERAGLYLRAYGERGKYYRETLVELNTAERQGLARREETARAAAAAEAASKEQQAIDSAWVTHKFRYWVMSNHGSANCSDTERKIMEDIRRPAMRGFSCSCITRAVDHPAWRQYDEDVCTGSMEVNKRIDPRAKTNERGTDNRWRLTFN